MEGERWFQELQAARTFEEAKPTILQTFSALFAEINRLKQSSGGVVNDNLGGQTHFLPSSAEVQSNASHSDEVDDADTESNLYRFDGRVAGEKIDMTSIGPKYPEEELYGSFVPTPEDLMWVEEAKRGNDSVTLMLKNIKNQKESKNDDDNYNKEVVIHSGKTLRPRSPDRSRSRAASQTRERLSSMKDSSSSSFQDSEKSVTASMDGKKPGRDRASSKPRGSEKQPKKRDPRSSIYDDRSSKEELPEDSDQKWQDKWDNRPVPQAPEDVAALQQLNQALADTPIVKCTPLSPEYKWQIEFEEALSLNEEKRGPAVCAFAKRFLDRATELGKVIIQETGLPRAAQSIKPLQGGSCYQFDGMLFKRAGDTMDKYVYGGKEADHELAAKAMANDLRASEVYFKLFLEYRLPIIVPIYFVLDFSGHRLMVSPLVPTSNGKVVYGSREGGPVQDSRPDVSAMLQFAAHHLHLATHAVGGKMLHTAGDVEAVASNDGRLFLSNLGRALPPEHPKPCTHLDFVASSVFYRSMRPEFLQHFKLMSTKNKSGRFPQLSPDALSMWGGGTTKAMQLNRATEQATEYLLARTKDLARHLVQSWDQGPSYSLSQIFHKWGVPLRHMALVRELLSQEDCVPPKVHTLEVTFTVKARQLIKMGVIGQSNYFVRVQTGRDGRCSNVIGSSEVQRSNHNPIFTTPFIVNEPLNRCMRIDFMSGSARAGWADFTMEQLAAKNKKSMSAKIRNFEDTALDKRLRDHVATCSIEVESTKPLLVGDVRRHDLLVEMVIRSFKFILRRLMRKAVESAVGKSGNDNVRTDVDERVVEFFNTLLGKTADSAALWSVELPRQLRRRFGPLCIRDREATSLQTLMQPHLLLIVDSICEATAIKLDTKQLLLALKDAKVSVGNITRGVRCKTFNFVENYLLEQKMLACNRVAGFDELVNISEDIVRLSARIDDRAWTHWVRSVVQVAKNGTRAELKDKIMSVVRYLRDTWMARVPPRLIGGVQFYIGQNFFSKQLAPTWAVVSPLWGEIDEETVSLFLAQQLTQQPLLANTLVVCSDVNNCLQDISHRSILQPFLVRHKKLMSWRVAECQQTFEEHENSVYCTAVLANGRLASGSADKSIKVWDIAKGKCILTLQGHSDSVMCLVQLQSGLLASGGLDNVVKIWDMNKPKEQCVATLQDHTDEIWCLASITTNGNLASGSRDETIRLWDPQSGECLLTLKGHKGLVRCMTSLADGRLVSGSRDNTIKVWDTSTGECLQTFSGHNDSISCMILLADGRLATASRDKTIKVWDVSQGKCLTTLIGLGSAVRCLTSIQGYIVSGSKDEALRVWDLSSKQCVSSIKGHQDEVWCLDLLPSGMLVSGSRDAKLKTWA